MGKTLVLAEKPSVGREIARVLGCKYGGNGVLEGGGYIVTWALGHLVTLADPDVYDKKWQELIDSLLIKDYHKRPDINEVFKYLNKNEILHRHTRLQPCRLLPMPHNQKVLVYLCL